MIFYRNTHILCLSRNWTDQKKTILYIFFLVGLTDFHAVSCFPVIWFSFYLWYQISGIQIPGIKNLWEILRKSFKRISSTRSNILMLCAIWYHLYNFKSVENNHGGKLLLAKFTLIKVSLLRGCFLRFLNCANGKKPRKVSHVMEIAKVSKFNFGLKKIFNEKFR